MKGTTAQPAPRNFRPQSGSPGVGAAGRPAGGVSLSFQIDHLTLPHMSRADSARVVAAMKKKLATLAGQATRRDWRHLSAIDRLDGGTIQPGTKPEQLGEHLAAQIFTRLK